MQWDAVIKRRAFSLLQLPLVTASRQGAGQPRSWCLAGAVFCWTPAGLGPPQGNGRKGGEGKG